MADVTLPSSSGIRVALEYKCCFPRLKIVIMSGYPASMWNEQDAAEFDEIPSDSVTVMQKPFTPAVLLSTVRRLIGIPTHRKAQAAS